MDQISNFKPELSTEPSAIFMIKWTSLNRRPQNICWEILFDEKPELASPWDHHPSKPHEVDKLSLSC